MDGVSYILRKGTPGMESHARGAALKERGTWQKNEYPIPKLKYMDDFLSRSPQIGTRLPQLVVFLTKVLYNAAAYRRPMPVREYILYPGRFGRESAFYLCPRCDITMEREYQSYCDRCGQRLGWKSIDRAKERHPTF